MNFKDLDLIEPILKALEEKGYKEPTPIQAKSIPILLEQKDLLGCAQTGTGKTAAFSIPILQLMYNKWKANPTKGPRKIKALIITPTRELAIQIADSFTAYGKHTGLRNTVIFGGVKQGAQTRVLKNGVDILVATPGRLLDLMGQGFISLKNIEYFVLDEADHMLDMGFIHDIRKVIKALPEKRQSLFFSATMPKSIVELSGKILGKYESVTVKPEQATAERVEQSVYFVGRKSKIKLLLHLLETEPIENVLVFCRTKHGSNKIVKLLSREGINAAAIHGNKSQVARQKALASFKAGKTRVLVATDIAARGIDVSQLPYVIQYDLPNVPETYVHRIGRTGRARASGLALSFCEMEERPYLKDIEKLIKQKIPRVLEHPLSDQPDEIIPKQPRGPRPPRRQGGKPKPKSKRPDNRNKGPKKDGAGKQKSGQPGNKDGNSGNKSGKPKPHNSSNKKKGKGPRDKRDFKGKKDNGPRRRQNKVIDPMVPLPKPKPSWKNEKPKPTNEEKAELW